MFLEDENHELGLKDVVHVYLLARNDTFKPETIASAWRMSGINPLNPKVFSDADFTPSHATLTVAHTPTSYPTIMPAFNNNLPSDTDDDDFVPPL